MKACAYGRVRGGSEAEAGVAGGDDEGRGVSGARREKSSLVAMSRMKERRGRSLED